MKSNPFPSLALANLLKQCVSLQAGCTQSPPPPYTHLSWVRRRSFTAPWGPTVSSFRSVDLKGVHFPRMVSGLPQGLCILFFLPGQRLFPRKSHDTLPAPFWQAYAHLSHA